MIIERPLSEIILSENSTGLVGERIHSANVSYPKIISSGTEYKLSVIQKGKVLGR
jgi:hypothetical protein